jgi:hypothetical protein
MLDRTKTGSGYLPQLMGVSRKGGGGSRPFERKRERRGEEDINSHGIKTG